MANKVFVGGLAWACDDDALREAFEDGIGCQVLSAKVITDRESGKSRGFGFVTFKSPGDAQQAIEGMDGQEILGRTIRVSEAIEKQGSNVGGGRRADGNSGRGDRPVKRSNKKGRRRDDEY